MSKREVSEKIAEYLTSNGIQGRSWDGIEQQVRTLENKFREALRYKLQTGEGIMEKAREDEAEARQEQEQEQEREARREMGVDEEDDDDHDVEEFVLHARNKIEVPLDLAESGVADNPSQICKALRLNNGEGSDSNDDPNDEPATQPQSIPNPASSPGVTVSARSSSLLKRARSNHENTGTPPVKKSNAERITNQIFPSKEEMDAQSAQDQSLARDQLENDKRLVDVTSKIAESMKPPTELAEAQSITLQKTKLKIAIQSYNFERRKDAKDLERKQQEVNVSKPEAELKAINLRADQEAINLAKAWTELTIAENEATQAKAHLTAITHAKIERIMT
ncbi:hypothetical protein Pst134EA_015786 [Puccinia striiformis f. sp. tritici]|uniref:hypothetical protein n=1 Tax=Puccinia striiformis f. sp. tritici TaxID=168172 RepID=UPI002008AE33|nr:hypothetical protein Pst134EA_015786 [Puccinia striiformis f. sp. tritici]KAH9463700.1 hypothetical protein Pst134EA_015786 [Puccinia striiformis f. sp. tritici]